MDHECTGQHPDVNPNLRFKLVATIENGALRTGFGRPFVFSGSVDAVIDHLYTAVNDASLPFDAADDYEYWLLDEADGAPLSLLQTCVAPEERDLVPWQASWVAMPAAQLAVPSTEKSGGIFVPPVNYRLEQAVEQRAGPRPRATWLKCERPDAAPRTLPPCLLREDWHDDEQRRLCESYINQLAPRLLMLADLPRETRQRLEMAARDHVFEVERFHTVYPEVVEGGLLKAARVEAKLRRSNSPEQSKRRV